LRVAEVQAAAWENGYLRIVKNGFILLPVDPRSGMCTSCFDLL
jgi:hypothetical protein